MIRRKSRILFATIAMSVGLSVALAGCSSPTASPSAEPTSTAATPTNTPTVTPTADPRVFAMPAQCVDIVPESRLASFEAANLVLLGGPGGRYEGDYLLDPTPEELSSTVPPSSVNKATVTSPQRSSTPSVQPAGFLLLPPSVGLPRINKPTRSLRK
jgi:hypothetical protein